MVVRHAWDLVHMMQPTPYHRRMRASEFDPRVGRYISGDFDEMQPQRSNRREYIPQVCVLKWPGIETNASRVLVETVTEVLNS